jgi:RHS repeat-associated protein
MNQILRVLKPLLLALLVLSNHAISLASPGRAAYYPEMHDGCPVGSPPPVVPISPVYYVRNTSIPVYQATFSITFEPGFSTAAGDAFTAQIVPGNVGVPQAANLTGTADANINWFRETTFDENGQVIGDDKSFYDNSGLGLQTQEKVFYRASPTTVFTHVLASQPILDAYGRAAARTLPAPINYADFSYQSNFLLHNSSGIKYNHEDFDQYNNGTSPTDNTITPLALWDATTGTPVPGTLAWYYSTQNTWEPFTPVTNYPYTRETYYSDGTGSAKKDAEAGDMLHMGQSHESGDFVTPVADELDFYLAVRNKYFPSTQVGALPGTLLGQAIQTVSRDQNGTETEAITDRSGNVLMSARTGAGITVHNTATLLAVAPGTSNIYYFKLLASGAVGITGGTFSVYDMMNSELAVSFTSGGTLLPGYYKVVNTGTTPLTLTYSNSYADVTYNFYNERGGMVASIAPNGVASLYGTAGSGLTNYATLASIPYLSQYVYDIQGRMVQRTDPDKVTSTNKGTINYLYRNDGKVRFSQDGVQASSGAYSYVNYDGEGRVIEVGQYDGSAISFGNLAASGILESTAPGGGLTTGTKTDVVMTQYDAADNSYSTQTGGLTGYMQDAFNLAGQISVMRRYSSVVNNSPAGASLVSATWYNYDEEEKVTWQIKYISGMGAGVTDPASYKTTDNTYDVMEHLVKRVFQAGTPAEMFTHTYCYDPVNQQLWQVFTSTTASPTPMLQATYYYYLHGGMKRVELGGDLQGVDYTYTLQGALKAINNSNSAQDPGGDAVASNGFGPDAFGEVLDYFTGDYSNSRTGIAAVTGVNAPAPTADSYVGNIKALSWYSVKPASVTGLSPNAYVYQYDPKYQFTAASWGAVTFSGTTTPATFTPSGVFSETVGNTTTAPYDGNGNIQFLQRTGPPPTGAVTDAFAYQYGNGNNQLTAVANTLSPGQNYATYQYDADGRVMTETTSAGAVLSLAYDAAGKLSTITRGGTSMVAFVYDEMGQRIKKLSYNTSGLLNQVTFYVGDVIYTQNVTGNGAVTATEYLIRGADRIGEYVPMGSTPLYVYELQDHLGNVRATVAQSGTVRTSSDYYPFGGLINGGGQTYRYDYQGQSSEKDPETGWNAFNLRMYDSRIGRWLQYDPKGQFNSPYVGMGNDPVNSTDPDGGCTGCPTYATEGDVYHENGQTFVASIFNGEAVWSPYLEPAVVSVNLHNYYDDIFLDRFQKNAPLTQPGDSRYYLDHVDGFNKWYSTRRAEWQAEGEIYKFFLIGVITDGAGDLIGEGIEGLMAARSAKTIQTVGTRAFWNGAGSEARAIADGFETLGNTRAGKNLYELTKDMDYFPGSDSYNMWARLSKAYAKGAKGVVHIYQNAADGVKLNSIWARFEYEALMNNPNVTEIVFHY